jgi:hypothetical protein
MIEKERLAEMGQKAAGRARDRRAMSQARWVHVVQSPIYDGNHQHPRFICGTIAPKIGVPMASQISIDSAQSSGIALTTEHFGLLDLLDRYFYFCMSLLIAVVVMYGFSHTVRKNLIHPAAPRPFILYVHAAVFSGWVIFFILQSTLVRTNNVALHRRTGWFGAALGVAITALGFATAVVMGRVNIFHVPDAKVAAFLIIPFFDMFAFSIPFALAIYFRKKPEFHRRVMLMATCALTAAAFGRFPRQILPHVFFYAGVDFLILLGAARDLIVNRRIHRVYLVGLPALVFAQIVVMYTNVHESPWWLKIAHTILG